MTLTPRDKQNLKTFGYGVLAVLAGGLIYLLCLAVCFWQSRYGVESETAIEWVQDIVLLISMGSFFTLAKLIPEERGGILLMAGFMTSLFIREQDAYFDFISKSAWQIVLAVFLVILFWRVWKRGLSEALEGVAHFVRSQSFVAMIAGLGMLLVYSRLYGSGHLWSLFISEEGPKYIAKRLSEESTELLGYALMSISAISYYVERIKLHR